MTLAGCIPHWAPALPSQTGGVGMGLFFIKNAKEGVFIVFG